MLGTGVYRLNLFTGCVHDCDGFVRRRYAAGQRRPRDSISIISDEISASGRHGGSSGNNEEMRRKTGALVRLKHSVPKCVLLGHLEVGLHIRWIDVRKLWIRRWTIPHNAQDYYFIGAIHSATIEHLHERFVLVVEVEGGGQR